MAFRRHLVTKSRVERRLVARPREGVTMAAERHVPVELRIPGPIHLAHAALADLGGDFHTARGWRRRHKHGWTALIIAHCD